MKLHILPISTRRSLLYCVHRNTKPPTIVDKASQKAVNVWLSWEKHEKGWQKYIVTKGNELMSRISYEETQLRQIPSLKSVSVEKADSQHRVPLVYPPSILQPGTIKAQLEDLIKSRQALHQKRLIWSVVGMPIVAPFAIVPIIPNVPFFYLCFRAFCHYKAILGIKHIQHLLDKDAIDYEPDERLDEVYRTGPKGIDAKGVEAGEETEGKERILLGLEDAERIAQAVGVEDVAVEWERAFRQVKRKLAKEEKRAEKTIREKAKSG